MRQAIESNSKSRDSWPFWGLADIPAWVRRSTTLTRAATSRGLNGLVT